MHAPILVCGTGRSGTSLTAGTLARLGVFMGARLQPADASNPWGAWEDRQFMQLDVRLLEAGSEEDTLRILRGLGALIAERRLLDRRWGFKDPHLAYLVPWYQRLLPDAVWVRCQRDTEASARSCVRAYGWTLEEARAEMTRRASSLSEHLRDPLVVDFDEARANREAFVERLVARLDLHPTDEQRAAAVEGIHGKAPSAQRA